MSYNETVLGKRAQPDSEVIDPPMPFGMDPEALGAAPWSIYQGAKIFDAKQLRQVLSRAKVNEFVPDAQHCQLRNSRPTQSVHLSSPIWCARALVRCKVDEFVPQTWDVNLRIVRQPGTERDASLSHTMYQLNGFCLVNPPTKLSTYS
jgi:hypothetical protein